MNNHQIYPTPSPDAAGYGGQTSSSFRGRTSSGFDNSGFGFTGFDDSKPGHHRNQPSEFDNFGQQQSRYGAGQSYSEPGFDGFGYDGFVDGGNGVYDDPSSTVYPGKYFPPEAGQDTNPFSYDFTIGGEEEEKNNNPILSFLNSSPRAPTRTPSYREQPSYQQPTRLPFASTEPAYHQPPTRAPYQQPKRPARQQPTRNKE